MNPSPTVVSPEEAARWDKVWSDLYQIPGARCPNPKALREELSRICRENALVRTLLHEVINRPEQTRPFVHVLGSTQNPEEGEGEAVLEYPGLYARVKNVGNKEDRVVVSGFTFLGQDQPTVKVSNVVVADGMSKNNGSPAAHFLTRAGHAFADNSLLERFAGANLEAYLSSLEKFIEEPSPQNRISFIRAGGSEDFLSILEKDLLGAARRLKSTRTRSGWQGLFSHATYAQLTALCAEPSVNRTGDVRMHWYCPEGEGVWRQSWASLDENEAGHQDRVKHFFGHPKPEESSLGRTPLDPLPNPLDPKSIFFLGTDGVTKVLNDESLLRLVHVANGHIPTLGDLIDAAIKRRHVDDYGYVIGSTEVLLTDSPSSL